jgi:hypothetical protein
MPKKPARETDLYEPLHDYLVAQCYTVRSEVKGYDVTATKDDDLIIIEMKRGFTLPLLTQATQAQRIADSVYVAIPMPDTGLHTKKWRAYTHLLKRLELGLILISPGRKKAAVQIAFHPVPFDRKRKNKERRAVLAEMAARTGDYNKGGSTGQKLVTAYREQAIHIACALERVESASPKDLRAQGTSAKTRAILYDDVYDWFERVDRALYCLSAAGRKALDDYPDLVDHYRALLDEEPEA